MASRPKQAEPRPQPRLYLITPPVADAAAFSAPLAAALAAGDIAAVLLRLEEADERSLINRVKALCPAVQDKGAALLLDGRANLVTRAGADGAHLSGLTAFTDAIEGLKPERIAGVGRLESRHDAMTAAETGADYVMFGEPDVSGARPSFAAIEERVRWWEEVFEIPCVGYAAAAGEILPLVKAGADFVALGDWLWREPDIAAAIRSAAAQSRLPETVG
ncbi:MAG TPA: thiamine phosphate synthase [Pseudolabrys sp.]|jgi:thiamine-phosphate pyrophosphorylase|nr:thiamine phosphate synthase [Pseudolabrys sp.]